MPKYLFTGSYTAQGAKGLLKDGGSKRRQAAADALKSVGATLEQFYFAFGDNDFYAIVDAPDSVSIAASSLAINASGGVQGKTVLLLTPDDLDQATKKTATYVPPGG
jgi:uncharacterized protein with GYD domain